MDLIIACMITKCNCWFLSRWLEHFDKYPVEKIILMIESINEPEYLELIKNPKVEAHFYGDAFAGSRIRARLYEKIQKYNPKWVMFTSDDEIFEDRMLNEVDKLIKDDSKNWYNFPIYHFYNSMTHYRNDGMWKGGQMTVTRLWRNNVLPKYIWAGGNQVWHVQFAPDGMLQTPGEFTDIRVKHFGHANPQASIAKRAERGPKWGQWTDDGMELVEWKENL